jgi:tRNA/tmRNA/rRNA uracil-C5-methylase (TrmA/RlmC/RlmD family)
MNFNVMPAAIDRMCDKNKTSLAKDRKVVFVKVATDLNVVKIEEQKNKL